MKTMNASTARMTFARAIAAVVKDGEPVVIVRYGRAIAALVPISRLAPAEQKELNSLRVVGTATPRRRG
jgi:prevent-host-death family protein